VEQSRVELSEYSWPEWPIQDAMRQEVNLSAAITSYEGALALHATNPSANRRLGQIELSLGDYKAALEHLGQAYRQRPWDNATQQLYGEALLLNGQQEAATALLERVNKTQGQLEARAFWYETTGDEKAADILREIQSE
jgi:predicted Zn-dependent protease